MATRTTAVRISAQIQEYIDGMQKVAQTTREAGSAGEKLAQQKQAFQMLGTALTVVGGAMTAVTLAVAKTGIEYNSLQQSSRAALTTLLGGAEAANAQMDKLDAFARTSPFAKQTFITAQQQMLAFGIESQKVIPYLDAIQDAVAAAGGSSQQLSEVAFVMSQISAAGKITGQDLMQFGQRGINAAELIGLSMGKTGAQIKSEITAGTLGADEALDALASGMKDKFDGAAANVKDTFSGAMDRVQAAWRDLSADLMKPLVDPNGGGALVGILNWAADLMRAVQQLPEPIKLVGGALFAVVGVVALLGGAVLLAAPQIASFKVALETLGVTGTRVKGALSGIGSFLTGPWGVALMVATAGVVTFMQMQEQARQKARDYAATLSEGAHEITDATREMIATNLTADDSFLWLSQGSLVDNAETLGLSARDLTKALEGNADAIARVNTAIEAGLVEGTVAIKDANLEAYDAAVLLQAGMEGEIGALGEAEKIARQKAEATGESADASLDGAEASKTAADAYFEEAKSVKGLVDELTGLVDTINAANGVAGDAITANAKYQSALSGISEEVERQKDAYETANETLDGFNLSLDRNTASGADNASMLWDVADASQNAAQKQFEQDQATMSADEAVSKYLGTLASQRQAFIDAAIAAGFNADEVNALADEIYALPDEKSVKILADTAAAQAQIDSYIYKNSGREIIVKIGTSRVAQGPGGAGGITNAEGGIYQNKIKEFAAGGTSPGIYKYQPGGIHRFAEEYDEAYISMDPARRQRSYGVWQQVGQQFGFAQQQQSAPAVSLDGMSITGTLDLGNGLTGFVDGIVSQRGTAVASGVRNRKWNDA